MHSQSSATNPTVCLPAAQLRGALKAVARGEVALAELQVKDSVVRELRARLALSDSALQAYQLRALVWARTEATYQGSLGAADAQRRATQARLDEALRSVKRLRRRVVLTGVAGACATTLAVLLLAR